MELQLKFFFVFCFTNLFHQAAEGYETFFLTDGLLFNLISSSAAPLLKQIHLSNFMDDLLFSQETIIVSKSISRSVANL
jgi:hypothetical protein